MNENVSIPHFVFKQMENSVNTIESTVSLVNAKTSWDTVSVQNSLI